VRSPNWAIIAALMKGTHFLDTWGSIWLFFEAERLETWGRGEKPKITCWNTIITSRSKLNSQVYCLLTLKYILIYFWWFFWISSTRKCWSFMLQRTSSLSMLYLDKCSVFYINDSNNIFSRPWFTRTFFRGFLGFSGGLQLKRKSSNLAAVEGGGHRSRVCSLAAHVAMGNLLRFQCSYSGFLLSRLSRSNRCVWLGVKHSDALPDTIQAATVERVPRADSEVPRSEPLKYIPTTYY
jgi:hypothetical protein